MFIIEDASALASDANFDQLVFMLSAIVLIHYGSILIMKRADDVIIF